MAELLGILFALIAALAWGSSLVPLKLAGKVDDIQFSTFIAFGIFLSTLIAMPFLNFSSAFSFYGFISGVMWVLGNLLTIISIRLIGLSKVAPIVGAAIILVSFLWGIFFFNEQLTSTILALIGIILLILGLPLIVSGREEKSNSSNKAIIYSLIAGIIFGSYITPLKLSALQPMEYIFSMALGILVTGGVVYLLSLYTRKQKSNYEKMLNGLLSGVLWSVGNLASLFAINLLGLSIGLPLTQMQLLVAVSWGIFYFKEVSDKRIIIKIILGAILLVSGAALLAFAK